MYWSVGALVAAFFGASSTVVGFVLVVLVLLILAVLQSMRLPRYARAEIDAIASDREAAAQVRARFDAL